MRTKYVVGYQGGHQCLYGSDREDKSMFCDGMTRKQARRKAKALNSPKATVVIYKLVVAEKHKNP